MFIKFFNRKNYHEKQQDKEMTFKNYHGEYVKIQIIEDYQHYH